MSISELKVAFIFSIALLSGCGREDIFQKPPAGSPALAPKPMQTSHITLAIRAPYSTLQQVIDAKIPSVHSMGAVSDEPCTDMPSIEKGSGILELPYIGSRRVCIGHHWKATLSKARPVSVSRNGDAIRVAAYADIHGQAGLRGDLARLFSLTGKNFQASVSPTVDLKLAIDKDWCPVIRAEGSKNWVTAANVEIVGRNCVGINLGRLGNPQACAGPVNLNLSNQANDALNEHIEKLSGAARDAINCEKIRDTVKAQWKPIAIPIEMTAGQPLFLNITPESVNFSEFVVTDDALRFAFNWGVKAQIQDTAVQMEPIELPEIGTLALPENSHLNVVLRATLPFSAITDSLKTALVGKSFVSTNEAGRIVVDIEDVEAYPSAGKVALGLKFKSRLPKRFFDTQGWVYMTTTPKVHESGTAIQLSDLKYSTVLDNKLWRALVVVFDTRILKELEKRSTFDLAPIIQKNSENLAAKLNSAKVPGLLIKAERATAKLLDVSVDSKSLVANASATMEFNVILDESVSTLASK